MDLIFFPIVQEINLEEVGAIHIKLIYGQNPKVYEIRKMRKCGIIYIKKLSQYPPINSSLIEYKF